MRIAGREDVRVLRPLGGGRDRDFPRKEAPDINLPMIRHSPLIGEIRSFCVDRLLSIFDWLIRQGQRLASKLILSYGPTHPVVASGEPIAFAFGGVAARLRTFAAK
jgi:hypothetical protein